MDSEDSDQTDWADAQVESSLGAHAILLVVSCRGSNTGWGLKPLLRVYDPCYSAILKF